MLKVTYFKVLAKYGKKSDNYIKLNAIQLNTMS